MTNILKLRICLLTYRSTCHQVLKQQSALLRRSSKFHFTRTTICASSSLADCLDNQIPDKARVKAWKPVPKVHVKRQPFTMKLDTPEFHALFTPELKTLADVFEKYNYELRIAGGAVRDLLMGIKPNDVDFASTATPTQMKEMFTKEEIRMLNMKGESHGTITARINEKENFEVTTLRIDILTDGRRAKVEFTTDWQLDANRRDLTVNSLFLGLDGTVYDYFNGVEDLKNRRIQFVGDPEQRIKEDYLRILRYFRFFGRLARESSRHEKSTLNAIKENVEGLAGISGERIWSELKKILIGPFNHSLMKTTLELGLASFIGLPEDPDVAEFDAVCIRSRSLNPHAITLLMALVRSETQFMNLHARLKFSAFERDLGLLLVMHREEKPCKDPLRPYQSLILETNTKQSDVKLWVEELLKYKGEKDLYEQLKDWEIPRFPVTGHDLVSYGISTGYRFQFVLKTMKRRWIDSGFTMTREELIENIQSAVDEADKMPLPSKKKHLGGRRDSR